MLYIIYCWGVPYRWTCPHVTYTNWTVSVQSQSQRSLSELLRRVVIFLIVKLRRGFSLLSFVFVLFAFNIFLITYFCVMSSFEPPLDHNIYMLYIIYNNIYNDYYIHIYIYYNHYKNYYTLYMIYIYILYIIRIIHNI